jgi:pilus assembly protein Flp/PilA
VEIKGDRDRMRDMIRRFAADECGSAAAEYGLIAAGLSIAIATVLQGIGLRLAANIGATRDFAR